MLVDKFKPPHALPQDWTLLPILLEVVWAPEVTLMFWRWKETIARTGTRSPDLSVRNVVAVPKHVTPYGIHKLIIGKQNTIILIRERNVIYMFTYPSLTFTGQLLTILEKRWRVIDIKCCRMALVMLSCKM
jgi:hypothetical protein